MAAGGNRGNLRMKYAIVNSERGEAVRGLKGTCPICEVPVTPRCGRFRVPHWSHPPGIVDHHWEPETEWHRRWKDFFPKECQEVCHRAENGERHLADVKTAHGQVLEFQHSAISEEERSSREAIYQPMCWVVNGLRLKNDRQKFFEVLRLGLVVQENPLTFVVPTASCLLLRKWENSQRLVVFDFGEIEESTDPLHFGAPVLWTSRPGRQKGETLLMPIYRARFLDGMIKNEPLIGVKGALTPVRVPAPSG
jgi:competence protein CoiA